MQIDFVDVTRPNYPSAMSDYKYWFSGLCRAHPNIIFENCNKKVGINRGIPSMLLISINVLYIRNGLTNFISIYKFILFLPISMEPQKNSQRWAPKWLLFYDYRYKLLDSGAYFLTWCHPPRNGICDTKLLSCNYVH